MRIHIIDSVKGGAGKSSIALKLALFLQQSANNPTQNKVCVIDMDLLGTSWEHTFRDHVINPSTGLYSRIYLNDLVLDYESYIRCNFIQKVSVLFKPSDELVTIDAIFCNPSPEAKKIFRISDESKVNEIKLDMFRNNIEHLTKYLAGNGYSDIIFDMPPNSDPYSDVVIKHYSSFSSGYTIFFYLVSAYDIAHLESTINYFKEIFLQPDSHKIQSLNVNIPIGDKNRQTKQQEKNDWIKQKIIHYFVVLNNNLFPDKTNALYDINNKTILHMMRSEEILKKLAYYIVDYDSAFARSKAFLSHIESYGNYNKLNVEAFDFSDYKLFDEI